MSASPSAQILSIKESTEMILPGLVISMPAGEGHVFRYKEGGHVEILYCYGDKTEL